MILSTPQQALEAEQAVLGAVFLKNSAMDQISTMLEPRDFSIASHELIWKAMKYLYDRNHPIDFITVVDMLKTYHRLDETGGVEYIIQLSNSVPTAANVEFYAGIVRSRSYRMRAYKAGEELMRMATEEEYPTDDEFFAETDRFLNTIRPQTNGDMKHVSEYRQEYFDYLAETEDFIYSGFNPFDEWMGGYGRGWLIIKAGRPSVGKTAKTLQEIVSIAQQDKGQVAMWSQEMKTKLLLNRVMPAMTGVNANRIRRKELDDFEKKKLQDAYDKLDTLPLHFHDAKNVTIEEVRATAKQLQRQYGKLAALVVDYLTIMKIPQLSGESRSQAVGRVTRTAKQIAIEMDCPFIMLAQLNRDGAGEPKLEHLRDSGEIEQDADVVEFLWHDPEETNPNGKIIQSTIAKGRDVGVNSFKYLFKGWLQTFEAIQ